MKNKFALHFIILLVGIIYFFTGCTEEDKGFTFIIASDTHYGLSDSLLKFNAQTIEEINNLPGTSYPGNTEKKVDVPLGVILSGDLTESGEKDQWNLFVEDYGLHGEGRLKFPVFEGFGNHDGLVDGPVRSGIKGRNQLRKGLSHISENGLHYSWKWQDIHFVQLNSYPSYEWDPDCEWCHYFNRSFREPQESLQFLKKDLSEQIEDSNREIILIFHYGFDDWGNMWWTQNEQDQFYDVIEKYNILAIFHGHSHNIQFYNWRGIPVFCVGSTQKDSNPGEFMVVRVDNEKINITKRSVTNGWGESQEVERNRNRIN